ncbi:MAG: exosortase/archaeosortase family protein [Terriglobia bacterium]|jgi:exosortase|nr:exosortase/archaeosortase family protein [Terriglobia bacterium]
MFASLFAAAIVLWMDTLVALLELSAQESENTHAILVIPIAISLIWLNRGKIFRDVSLGLVSGPILLASGIALRILCSFFQASIGIENSLSISILSLVLVCIGVFALAYGTRAVAAAQFPLVMLGFIVPFPSYVVRWINLGLQYGSTVAVDWLLYLAGVPFHRDGFVILLPLRSIEIAEQCSGIRAAIILFILSMVVAHLYLRTMVLRTLLVAASVPISIIKNGLRILALCLLSNYADPEILESEFHRHSGMVFFAISIMALYFSTLVLKWIEKRKQQRSSASQRRIDHSPACV